MTNDEFLCNFERNIKELPGVISQWENYIDQLKWMLDTSANIIKSEKLSKLFEEPEPFRGSIFLLMGIDF